MFYYRIPAIFIASLLVCLTEQTEIYENIIFPEDLAATNQDNRIINGYFASKGQFPWQVHIAFETLEKSSRCGGSLIHPRWVLSAAHCMVGAYIFTITLGTVDLSTTEIGTVVVVTDTYYSHEDYNTYLNNDIGVIDLKIEIGSNEFIQPISLPTRADQVASSTLLQISGFGKTSDIASTTSPQLKWTNVISISNEMCSRIFGNNVIIDSTICAMGAGLQSTCNGDSGGGLIKRDELGNATLVGVVSFVSSSGCSLGYPSGYVRTESFLSWISNKTGIEY